MVKINKYREKIYFRKFFGEFMTYKKIIIVICILFIAGIISAATTGRISGKVVDENNNPISYAKLILEGSNFGVQADEAGQYLLRFVPPGKHNIVCSQVGYKSEKVVGLLVTTDETSIQNFRLQKSAVEVEGIVVSEAKNKLVDKLSSGSVNVISQAMVEAVDAPQIEDLIALQAGAYQNNQGELHIRGGKVNEVVYIVDGISVTDVVDGRAALAIDVDAISEMKVMTGGFPAEYGNAQSGIINIITKSGSASYQGGLEFSSDFISNVSNQEILKFRLSGPVFPHKRFREKLTFFFNAKIDRLDSHLREYYNKDPYEEMMLNGQHILPPYWQAYTPYDPYQERDKFLLFDLGERNTNKLNINTKIAYKLSEKQKMDLSYRRDESLIYPYDHRWLYALENYAELENRQEQAVVSYSNSLNSQVHLTAKFSYYKQNYREQPHDFSFADIFQKNEENFELQAANEIGNCTGIDYLGESGYLNDLHNYWYGQVDGNYFGLGNYFYAPGSYYNNFIKNQNTVLTAKLDLDYQYDHVHNFRSGLELINYRIEKEKLINPWVLDGARYYEFLAAESAVDSVYNEITEQWVGLYSLDSFYDATIYAAGDRYKIQAQPLQAALYVQDRMEWEGLVVNAGLRLDSWYLGDYYQRLSEQGEFEKVNFTQEEALHFLLSPRLGISHAISEKNVLHFAFNYQSQLPQLQHVYAMATPHNIYTGNAEWTATVLGNPQIEPQITITGEVGLQRQISENFFADATVYYKKNYNYPSIEKVAADDENNIFWYRYVSDNYGNSRGLDLNIQGVLNSFCSVAAAYSLSWAEGTATDFYDFEYSEEKLLQEFPLDWDSRHNLTGNFIFRIAPQQEFYLPWLDYKLPFSDLSVNFNYTFASGTPYTDVAAEEVNGARLPNSELANLKISKGFELMGKSKLKIYLKFRNLFNSSNINFAYINTGSPYYDGQEFEAPEEQVLHSMYTKNPQNISSQREISLGAAISW
jgi:outer membrane receptor for ferrienterochelin and colicin